MIMFGAARRANRITMQSDSCADGVKLSFEQAFAFEDQSRSLILFESTRSWHRTRAKW
jgi:hypothetical protein